MGASTITLYAVVEDSGSLHESDYGVLAFTSEAALLSWEGRDHRRYVKIVGTYEELGPTKEHLDRLAARAKAKEAASARSAQRYQAKKAKARYVGSPEHKALRNRGGA